MKKVIFLICILSLLCSGCALRTVDELYYLPKRSDTDDDLQAIINREMTGLSYCAPISGENRQGAQMADLDGDGVEECLVFAKDTSDKPLKILIFCQLASGYVLMDTIEGYGFAFDFVEYTQIDGQSGLEIVVGRQVSDGVLRSISVYRFSSEISRQLLTVSYSKMVTCDLDGDGKGELLLLDSGDSQESPGVLTLYRYAEGELSALSTAQLSHSAGRVKRMSLGKLQNGDDAVFITGITQGNAMIPDVFTLQEGELKNLSPRTPVPMLGSYYVYPWDVDADGIMELPELVPMPDYPEQTRKDHFVRWYSLTPEGIQREKRLTYMNYAGGWFLTLENKTWANTLSVVAGQESTAFYMWDAEHETARKIMTITALSDSDREEVSQQKKYTVLYKADAVIYVAALEPAAESFGLNRQVLLDSFALMRKELNSDEN